MPIYDYAAQSCGPEFEALMRAQSVPECPGYLNRFPDAAETLELGDFPIVALQPVSARLVAGFGRAYGLVGESLIDWLRKSPRLCKAETSLRRMAGCCPRRFTLRCARWTRSGSPQR